MPTALMENLLENDGLNKVKNKKSKNNWGDANDDIDSNHCISNEIDSNNNSDQNVVLNEGLPVEDSDNDSENICNDSDDVGEGDGIEDD